MHRLNALFTAASLSVVLITIERFSFTAVSRHHLHRGDLHVGHGAGLIVRFR
jgi:hypothetical protein